MRILYISTVSNTINTFLIPHIELLVSKGHKVDIASKVLQPYKNELKSLVSNSYNFDFSRNIFSFSNVKAYFKFKRFLLRQKYDVIHTHTPVVSTIVRIILRNNKSTKVFYTAHGFHFFKGSSIVNWLFFYPIEKYLSKFTDSLITINKEDYLLAKKTFKAKHTYFMPGVGFDINKFSSSASSTILRSQFQINTKTKILLSVGELNRNKNHISVIRAISKLKDLDLIYFICGEGSYRKKLEITISNLNLNDKVILLGYRTDVPNLLDETDLFIMPSLREGLSVALMEAMASGLPVIASNIRGNTDLIKHYYNGYLVNPLNYKDFSIYINLVINNSSNLQLFSERSKIKIKEYSIEVVNTKMIEIYNTLL
jgi:glycosyltransferase involved in cell wall biosynthesis